MHGKRTQHMLMFTDQTTSYWIARTQFRHPSWEPKNSLALLRQRDYTSTPQDLGEHRLPLVSNFSRRQVCDVSLSTLRQESAHMKYNIDRLMEAKKAAALVSACSISIDQAIHVASLTVGGTVFDAKLKEVQRQPVWRVKLLTGGRRVKIYIDARSGRVLEAKAEITIVEPYQGMTPNVAISLPPTTLEPVPQST